jgi:GTP diphosphokinase / guanosine-3',5'-bis(diphosphate) 3'-diphosphatase
MGPASEMRTEFTKLIKQLRKRHSDEALELVRHAYRFANNAHAGQVRLSGDPFISHCIEVAKALAALGLDLTTIVSALLHDVLEDTSISLEQLTEEFGEEVASLVDGVTKIGALHFAPAAVTNEEKQAENLRKMLIATAKDARVILIKLADRLHNMRTIEFLPPNKIQSISQETLEIYAPLANRLGIGRWKWELEDHAFHQMHPDEYRETAARVAMKRKDREVLLNDMMQFLEDRLSEAEVSARVLGRPKHLYGIYQKMLEQGKDFDQVLDVLAIRVVTQTEAGCYNALGVVHQLWPPVPMRFKDYIAMPKNNMYQSVHTTVMHEAGIPLEVQIRTEEMDRNGRDGIAAHWVYKEGKRVDQRTVEHLQWLRQMYEWLQDAHAPDELLDSLRRDVSSSYIYVFTPKGEVKELPTGATPVDFAYFVHSDVGHQCIGARVNGRMVPLRYNLQMGDVVEILTSKNQTPHLDWLEIVVTGKARTRIRQRLREIGDLEPLDGRPKREWADEPPPQPSKPKVQHVDPATRAKLIRIDGTKDMDVGFAKCCEPMPGEAVIGYVTRMGMTVHRADCKNFASTERDPDRVVEASWEGDDPREYGMRVTTGQRPNVLADITKAIRPMNINITRAEFHAGKNGAIYFDFVFEASDETSFELVSRTLRTVPGVSNVSRMPKKRMPKARRD